MREQTLERAKLNIKNAVRDYGENRKLKDIILNNIDESVDLIFTFTHDFNLDIFNNILKELVLEGYNIINFGNTFDLYNDECVFQGTIIYKVKEETEEDKVLNRLRKSVNNLSNNNESVIQSDIKGQTLEGAKLNIQQGISDYLAKRREREIAVELKGQTLERTRPNIEQDVKDYLGNTSEIEGPMVIVEEGKYGQTCEKPLKNRLKKIESYLRDELLLIIDANPKLKANIERIRVLSKMEDENYTDMHLIRDGLIIVFCLISLPLLNLLPLSASIPLIFAYAFVMYKKFM